MNRKFLASIALVFFLGLALRAGAQDPAPPPAPDGTMLGSAQLDQLTGPIALYPDPLIAQILPAATQPSQVAVAYNYIASGGDPNMIDQQPWDSSVKALAHYPDALKTLNDNLPWTTQLGQAFLNQPSDVMDSVQRLRAQAQQLGNLANTPQETVDEDDGDIEIMPTDPNMLYVPTYDPGLIFYTPCYGRPFITFGVGFGIGLWLNHDFDWHGHNVITWGAGHPRPANWWHEPPAQRHADFGHATVWRPDARVGGRVIGRPVAVRGDRGFVNREVRVAAPAPRAVEVHTIPARPTVSAFTGGESAHDTRAASSRGVASRAAAGGGGGGGRRR